MKCKVVEKAYPDNPDAPKKQYANPVNRVVTKIEIHYLCVMKYETVQGYEARAFRTVTGVAPETFSVMLDEVKPAYAKAHRRRGRHRKLSLEDMLLMKLEYYREYRTLECIGVSCGLRKTNAGKVVKWVEEVLIASGRFRLSGKKKLLQPDSEIEVIVADTTETPVQRPGNGQQRYYSGKKTTYGEVSGCDRQTYGTDRLHGTIQRKNARRDYF